MAVFAWCCVAVSSEGGPHVQETVFAIIVIAACPLQCSHLCSALLLKDEFNLLLLSRCSSSMSTLSVSQKCHLIHTVCCISQDGVGTATHHSWPMHSACNSVRRVFYR